MEGYQAKLQLGYLIKYHAFIRMDKGTAIILFIHSTIAYWVPTICQVADSKKIRLCVCVCVYVFYIHIYTV